MSIPWEALKRVRALVVGDCMLDRYIEGAATRISPEAPVPVVAVARDHACLGGAANVAAGIAALGYRTTLAGVIGADADGLALRSLLAEAEVTDMLLVDSAVQTICKTRVLADRGQQLLRLDRDGSSHDRARIAARLTDDVVRQLPDTDVVVLADYEKGTLPPAMLETILQACAALGIPTVVDPKKSDFSSYAGATVVTPNVAELERAAASAGLRTEALATEAKATIARDFLARYGFQYVLCTCGADGMLLVDFHRTLEIPARARGVADVAGAGDTVVAVLAAALGAAVEIEDACRAASLAAAVAVGRPRVYVVQRHELEEALRPSPKIVSPEAAEVKLQTFRREGRRIVFTNGCFDLLHAGHLANLEEAKSLGDVLVVGLNSDESVFRLKGSDRPRIKQEHRAALLAGLACVDLVVVFSEDTPENLVRRLRPDILTKGGDYAVENIAGADFVQSYGGRVVITPLLPGLSTTAILGES